MSKNSFITVTDQFCGAGGSSQGVRSLAEKHGGGLEVKLALNHWKLAIETHNTNFPDTIHDCTDISACDPRRYPSTDILITSPECTNHSLASGRKSVKNQIDMFNSGKLDAAAERSRATMWDVCRFAEFHSYNAIIVENVVDARKWIMWDAWLNAMHVLGYLHKCVYLNSMHCHPTPQSRDRMYIVFWKKGNRAPDLEYRPSAYCPVCEKDTQSIQSWKRQDKKFGKYRTQYVYCCPSCSTIVEPYYYASFNCIDWSDIGTRIGDRPKPLSPKTIARIEYGLEKHGGDPLVINCQHSTGVSFRVRSAAEKIDTITTTPNFRVVTPFIIKLEHSQRADNVSGVLGHLSTQTTRQSQMIINGYVRPISQPLQTQTTTQGMGVVVPYIMEMNRTGKCKPITEPTATFTAGGINHAVVNMPIVVENKGESMSRPVTSPAGCITTKPHLGIVTSEAFNAFLSSYNNGSHCTQHITAASGSVTTRDRMALNIYREPNIEDCFYRMLKPHEIQTAMAFDRKYVVLGNGRDKVKQLGNAVTPPAMEWLVGQVVDSLS